MKEYFNINEDEYKKLIKCVSIEDQIKSAKLFTTTGEYEPDKITKLGLMYFIDRKGTYFLKLYRRKTPEEKIAKAIFNSLNVKEKLEIYHYAEGHDENWKEGKNDNQN